jgi:EAL domain-containing protein (putative c-di-GMP-specific phosphodiesterase class I)
MGKPVVARKLRKPTAILLGLVLAGLPAATVHVWLGRTIERQGISELDVTARRAMGLAEGRLVMVAQALDGLAARGVRSCAGVDLEAMHETAFRVVPIKELSVVEPAGGTRCTNLAVPLGERSVIGTISNPRSDITIEIVRLGDGADGLVRIRRDTGEGSGLAALMPADIMLPRTSSNGGPHVIDLKLMAADGTVFGERLPDRSGPADAGEMLTVQVQSRRFGMVVLAAIGRARVMAGQRDFVAMVVLGTGAAALIMLLLASGALRRPNDPASVLAEAIRNGELVPYYQPIVDLTTARVVSAEVLVRWRKPDGSLVPPVQFIPVAEASGLIVDLTRAVMRRVCAEAGAAVGARPDFRIGFNLSARHFIDQEIVDDVQSIFAPSPIALSQILLEVTERQALDDLDVARRIIAALQGLGVGVGIDDVGTGHSGLSYMLKLGVDFIKIDKMFVDALDTERYSATIIETLVGLARDMRMEIIAEGVETFEQVQNLRSRGIRRAQGYVFAPPLPGASFLRLLEAAHGVAVDAPVAPSADAPVAALVA